MPIEVDTERLRREAEALGASRSWLDQATVELDSGCAIATDAFHAAMDGGLSSALGHLASAWRYDITSVADDVRSIAEVVEAVAGLYGAADQDGAMRLGQ